MKLLKHDWKWAGFSGQRNGMTEAQEQAFYMLLKELMLERLDHGDCVGSDENAHDIALKIPVPVIGIHPPTSARYRAHCETRIATGVQLKVYPPRPFLIRDRNILVEKDVLIATPRTPHMPISLRGQGTWTTVWYAKQQDMPCVIVSPNGDVRTEK